MIFELFTLIDISETKVYRGPDRVQVSKQANYNTIIQTIGLRANPLPSAVEQLNEDVKKHKFGSNFKDKHNIWKLTFEIEMSEAHSLSMLENDFNLVPILTELDETIEINTSVLKTTDIKEKNIYFNLVDN